MKQSAAKTLGVAALGAAFAAAGAGAANAAPAVPDAAAALETVTSTLPVADAARTLPAGGAESLGAGQNALASGLSTAKPTIEQTAPSVLPADDKKGGDPLSGLLGGLPVKSPVGGNPVGGVPVVGGGGLPVAMN